MSITTASRTDVGRLRTHNEDDCGEFRSEPGHLLLVVADGMGGHRGGATASRMAVETVGRIFQTEASAAKLSDPARLLSKAFGEANTAIYQASLEDTSLRGMGTTVVCLLCPVDGSVWIAHVGDSRAYRLRANELELLTEDHSLVAELQRRGLIDAEEALVHPRRNEILRSIGVLPEVETDVREVDVREGDCFALCSDGLSGVVRDPEIAEVLAGAPPNQKLFCFEFGAQPLSQYRVECGHTANRKPIALMGIWQGNGIILNAGQISCVSKLGQSFVLLNFVEQLLAPRYASDVGTDEEVVVGVAVHGSSRLLCCPAAAALVGPCHGDRIHSGFDGDGSRANAA